MFVGFLTGHERAGTPPEVQFPRRAGNASVLTGAESGNDWEGRLLGGIVQAYADPESALRDRQCGNLCTMYNRNDIRTLHPGWIRDCLALSE